MWIKVHNDWNWESLRRGTAAITAGLHGLNRDSLLNLNMGCCCATPNMRAGHKGIGPETAHLCGNFFNLGLPLYSILGTQEGTTI